MEEIVTNEAKWNKSCYNKLSNAKLTSARKRQWSEVEAESSDVGSSYCTCIHDIRVHT